MLKIILMQYEMAIIVQKSTSFPTNVRISSQNALWRNSIFDPTVSVILLEDREEYQDIRVAFPQLFLHMYSFLILTEVPPYYGKKRIFLKKWFLVTWLFIWETNNREPYVIPPLRRVVRNLSPQWKRQDCGAPSWPRKMRSFRCYRQQL